MSLRIPPYDYLITELEKTSSILDVKYNVSNYSRCDWGDVLFRGHVLPLSRNLGLTPPAPRVNLPVADEYRMVRSTGKGHWYYKVYSAYKINAYELQSDLFDCWRYRQLESNLFSASCSDDYFLKTGFDTSLSPIFTRYERMVCIRAEYQICRGRCDHHSSLSFV